ncbi:MAG: phenylalanine--tRNA ligase subunit alpha [Endomicrobium sp.]|jgi:phenylalanyl-tRNA synthetase alpha chain|uniref:phenylalanine--tRNA ligase subunit alpha n=1 Tax=Candidatus Endomicrobiellum cubanum TaxID=3242325 RepID=UPI00282EF6D8|nr:phenylalanine--tRNA ligase subunit alpha [Endomicrobium sp.]MDR2395411.1 phenylalanine--tRNA ligase subunit alpha [Endomicrobium sp.]
MNNIESIIKEAILQIKEADLKAIESIKVKYSGKSGVLTQILKSLSNCSVDDKKRIGQEANKAKNIIETEIELRKEALKKEILEEKMQKEKLDYSNKFYFPFTKGSFHPIIQTIQDISSVFKSLGFSIAQGPEIETNWYNFEALNIPQNHPARDVQDTFYLVGMKELLRTHTSPGQIHVMETQKPPIRVIVPGKVYRNEASDATHSATFHQVEGLSVDENITFVDLKAVLSDFTHEFFGTDVDIRFRPSYFQFTEPSAEVDMQCIFCKGKGCRICKNSGWIELLGCGMVHPNVLKAVNYDSEKYTGYAFGIGVERIAMFKYGIDDIRLFYENDLRFLKQF